MKKQSGFTLIEIAIVLVIIGLLLGGVLKGQELINSARVKNLANDFRTVPTYIYGYQDRFRAIPGDDPAVVAHVNGTLATGGAGTVGNGLINGLWNSATATDESFLFWQHVRLANFAPGPTAIADASYAPTNALGARIGVTAINPPIAGMTGSYYVCSGSIDGGQARQLDVTLDDGVTDTGSLRVTTNQTAPTAAGAAALPNANVTTGTPYVVCLAI